MRVFKLSKTAKKVFDAKLLREIEERGAVALVVKEDEVEITANDEENGGAEWIAEQVIKALVYGFEPKHAFKLFNDEYFLETIDLENAFHRKEKDVKRAKSRIIGEGGKARKNLEQLSDTHILVSNLTDNVTILGKFQDLQNAKEAIIRLLEGSPHESVYKFLENKKEY
ncbi:MAG: KH domain-containing protein [Candidatus Micrarchaeota archaeon]